MTVYVDPLFPTERSSKWPYNEASHMTADSEEELHAMAAKLKLRRNHFQYHHPNKALWHYDLTKGNWYQAIRHGARVITWHERYLLLKEHMSR